jgi:hypothetical protein
MDTAPAQYQGIIDQALHIHDRLIMTQVHPEGGHTLLGVVKDVCLLSFFTGFKSDVFTPLRDPNPRG